MIKFDLYISPNFRGGEYFRSFQTSNFDDLVSQLKHYWFRTGFHSSTGEISVFTSLEISGARKNIQCGYYVIEDDGTFFPLSSKDHEYEIEEYWEKLGVNFDTTSDEDLFEVKARLLLEPNGPTRLLGSWIDAMWDASYDTEIDEYCEKNDVSFEGHGQPALAHVLSFAKDHSKLFEMFEWLATNEAANFLSNSRYLPLGKELMTEVEKIKIDARDHAKSKEDISKFLEAFVTKNSMPFSKTLTLN